MENEKIIRKVMVNQLYAEIREEVKSLLRNNLETKEDIIKRIGEKIHALIIRIEQEENL
jgi:predicted metal-dependent RNase